MEWTDVIARIEHGLGNLPGLDAQIRMAPRPRLGWRPGTTPEQARVAAGLLLLYPTGGHAIALLTKRSSSLPQHGGQVSLPGGAVDPGETIEAAALREAHEEVGLSPLAVAVVGRLTPLHIPVSGFLLHTVIGLAQQRPVVFPASPEVDRIIEVPVSELADLQHQRCTTRMRDGIEIETPYFDVDGEQVWGATAMVLAELVALLARPPAP
ncbi:MAG: CoA pyrophosphatase [Acidobacteriota bacterium]